MSDSSLPINGKSRQPFVQWQKSSMSRYRELLGKSPKAALLLSLLVENMNDSNAVVVSQNTLAEMMGCTRRSIINYIKILESDQWLNVLKIGTANVYHVNRSYFWQQAANKRFYSKINASVILSETDQKLSIDELQKDREVTLIPKANDTDKLVILDDEEPPTQPEMEL